MRRIFIIFAFIATLFCSAAAAAEKQFVLVLDPGHGGKDYGAIGEVTNEKSINLAVALQFGKLVEANMPEVKVVYTRNTDVFVSLNDRAKIANKAKGDLFVSIHVNSVDRKNRNRANVAGAEVFTLGLHKTEENLAIAKRENSVIALEADYSESYKGFDPNSVESYIIFELSQSIHLDQSIAFAGAAERQLVKNAGRIDKGVKQAGFWVLWATSMPAVLVELDFICNPRSEAFLNSKDGRNKLATSLYNAFAEYRGKSTPSAQRPANNATQQPQQHQAEADTASEPVTTTSDTDAITYRIQIATNPTPLKAKAPELKGEQGVDSYYEKGLYKYTLGNYSSLDEARKNLPAIRKKFNQAFIIKMQGNQRIYD